MDLKSIHISNETYNSFHALKKLIQENSWEEHITDDELVDFMVRIISESIESEKNEFCDCHNDGWHCCWKCHHH